MTPPRPSAQLGEIIRRQRQLNRLTLRQFAAMAGISNPYLSQIERGLRAPSEAVVDAIAKSLRTSPGELYEQAGIAHSGDERVAARERLEAALADDPHLSAKARRTLLELYDLVAAPDAGGSARR